MAGRHWLLDAAARRAAEPKEGSPEYMRRVGESMRQILAPPKRGHSPGTTADTQKDMFAHKTVKD